MSDRFAMMDGNEAAARVAHSTNEVIAIYPITPASPMGELSDAWSAAGKKNLFGVVPEVIEMQSEAGAAGAVHGSLQAGALTTTFTASQGLLLMIPNMFKIAGELTPTVFHIAARSIATHALSIFGDHSDVMATRSTGWAMLASSNVQEVHDMAMISHAATLEARIPFLHFFDGFRTSHEISKIELLDDDVIRSLLNLQRIEEHRNRALDPDRPVLRGSAQNPDVFFQAREAVNPFYARCPQIVQQTMDAFAEKTGRQYHLYDYCGAADAERVIVMIGSGCGAAEETIDRLTSQGEKVGLLKVRLFRPFAVSDFIATLPATAQQIAVLDRTKEPGAIAEPLHQDVAMALTEAWCELHPGTSIPSVVGGRYGLSSKEFTPAMAKAVLDELKQKDCKRRFTVGIIDDVTHLSLKWDNDFSTEPNDVTRAVFYGLGSDGTVSANKSSVKIIGEMTPMYAQGYFVYDSKKSGSITVSHLRFGPRPIHSTYLVRRANFVACHQFQFLKHIDVLETAEPGATFLLNSPYSADEVWEQIPQELQQEIIDKQLRVYVVDALAVARDAGLGNRINTVMQTCFFALAGILPRDEAIDHIKKMIAKTYGKSGRAVIERNFAAVEESFAALAEVTIPSEATSTSHRESPIPDSSPDFVKRVTAMMVAGKGDLLPVSALPVDGTFPTATSQYEKRSIAHEIPIWDADICIECGLCALVCPHAAIRTKAYPSSSLNGMPDNFQSKPWTGKELDSHLLTIQVAPDDCTGCGVCVDICPAKSKASVRHKAINMSPKSEHLDAERQHFDYFLSLPEVDRQQTKISTVKGSQLLLPLFEYSGACAGCGETSYLKLLSQLFGNRILVANATGCSSIYGGNLPTTPWSVDREGRGPAWNNSLFEDNAEFGLGMRLALDQKEETARYLLSSLASQIGDTLVDELLKGTATDEAAIARQRIRVAELKRKLVSIDSSAAKQLLTLADVLVPRSVWIVGGDGWAYDIGFGGLDHVLASDRNVNILVLDTEVYSNTGGQASKATPRAAVAKFAASGKSIGRKDLGMIAVAYGNVFVAQIAVGAQPLQTLKAFQEAESYGGPSLILAYSPCIAHGIDMSKSMSIQKDIVKSGFWPLYRYDPREAHDHGHPFHLDSRKPTVSFRDMAMKEGRFAMLTRSNPERASHLFDLAQREIDDRWQFYEQMAGVEREAVESDEGATR
ncbi:pyruvate:ferredoxin (flavodoxin) oxidoreductase [Rhodopirellula sp. ICT_H3.1]|uniref:Pyruvate:ferredoxin (Flavodoxin) oxidoreductase n=2 Tax=Aporhodopirellula aestuarii TaxID=2950107 RepID=A0ABT0TZA1_9BACT|nr:pyruvate:ferredoxin (flavodoxin) oxidoreductase [Aporhodopirellula aestuarii]